MKTTYLIAGAIVLLFSAMAESKTFDVGTCSAFRNALNQASRGDIIQYGDGTFECAFDTKHDGVTFRGAPGYKTRLFPSGGSSGKQIIGVKHDDIVLERLVINGEKRSNSGHGLVRVGSSQGLRIQYNHFLDSGSSHINIGGSFKRTTIRDVQVVGNILKGSGYQGEYGEAIYIGDYAGSGSVRDVIVAGNEISHFTDNAIDVKPPARDIKIYHNDIHDQEERGGTQINTGTLVVQGRDVKFHDNYIRGVIPGKAVFNLVTKAGITIENNVVEKIRGAQALVRSRGNGSGGTTATRNNLFCDTGGTKMQSVSGISNTNYTITGDTGPCRNAAKPILAEVAKYQAGVSIPDEPGEPDEPDEPDEPKEPLPKLRIVNITYGETAPFNVRVYTESVEPGTDTQMEKREYREGSVLFYSMDSEGLTFYQQKRAPARFADGWNFRLDEPYPDASIRMVAETGWIDGGPAIDTVIPRWGADTSTDTDTEPLPTVELEPGQRASCDLPTMILGQTDSKYLIECGKGN